MAFAFIAKYLQTYFVSCQKNFVIAMKYCFLVPKLHSNVACVVPLTLEHAMCMTQNCLNIVHAMNGIKIVWWLLCLCRYTIYGAKRHRKNVVISFVLPTIDSVISACPLPCGWWLWAHPHWHPEKVEIDCRQHLYTIPLLNQPITSIFEKFSQWEKNKST